MSSAFTSVLTSNRNTVRGIFPSYTGILLTTGNINGSTGAFSAYTTNGTSWTQGSMPATSTWSGLASNQNITVAGTGSNQFASTTNYTSWTSRTNPGFMDSIDWGNGRFVSVAGNPAGASYISTDGLAWTNKSGQIPNSTTTTYNYRSVVFSWDLGIHFVNKSFNQTSDHAAVSSDGGVTWTSSTLPSSQQWTVPGVGKGKIIVPSGFLSTSNSFAYTSNGFTWSTGNFPSSQYWSNVAYSSQLNLWVAVSGGFIAASTVGAYSTDGITWQASTMPSGLWYRVLYVSGVGFIAINGLAGYNSNIAAISTNGTTWTTTTLPQNALWGSMVAVR